MEWLTRVGFGIFAPLFHSPDVDVVAAIEEGRLIRVQVKTSTSLVHTPDGHPRWSVQLATRGGNQSWNGVSKIFDPSRCDFLFVLTGNWRKWFVPSAAIEGQHAIRLGGPKYSEFEVDLPGAPAGMLGSTMKNGRRGSVGVGEPNGTVNPAPRAEGVRIPPPPSSSGESETAAPRAPSPKTFPTRNERTRISVQHQVTIPSVPFREAGLRVGDRLRSWADGRGRVILERIEEPAQPLFHRPPGAVASHGSDGTTPAR